MMLRPCHDVPWLEDASPLVKAVYLASIKRSFFSILSEMFRAPVEEGKSRSSRSK